MLIILAGVACLVVGFNIGMIVGQALKLEPRENK